MIIGSAKQFVEEHCTFGHFDTQFRCTVRCHIVRYGRARFTATAVHHKIAVVEGLYHSTLEYFKSLKDNYHCYLSLRYVICRTTLQL